MRELFDDYITEILDIFVRDDRTMKDQYTWEDVFSKNTKQLVEELEIALNVWLISKRTALKRYLGMDDSEVDIEIGLMDKEVDEVEEVLPVEQPDVETD